MQIDPFVVKSRLWLIFFCDGTGELQWTHFMAKGFRHVSAAAYYADQDRWVYYDPTFRGTTIELWERDDFARRLERLLQDSSHILRFPSVNSRKISPACFWCVGAIKGLLGIHSGALWPKGLYRDLLARGAEIVTIPEGYHGEAADS